MPRPLDPNAEFDGNSEYSWGPGLFPPGIAENEGQSRPQDDFGDNMIPQTEKVGSHNDNYARMVADRRTDSLDPDSGRDFQSWGNPDRYGPNPALVKAAPERNVSQRRNPPPNRLERKP